MTVNNDVYIYGGEVTNIRLQEHLLVCLSCHIKGKAKETNELVKFNQSCVKCAVTRKDHYCVMDDYTNLAQK